MKTPLNADEKPMNILLKRIAVTGMLAGRAGITTGVTETDAIKIIEAANKADGDSIDSLHRSLCEVFKKAV